MTNGGLTDRYSTWGHSGKPPSAPQTGSSAFSSTSNTPKFDFHPGDIVKHRKFGRGTVKEAHAIGSDCRMVVAFDEIGDKHLMAAYANLEKADGI